jgi:hypothetical protein
MTLSEADRERLRAALLAEHPAGDPAPASAPTCPEPDELWAASRGESAPERVAELVDHAAACPACARELWLALAVDEEVPDEAAPAGAVTRGPGTASPRADERDDPRLAGSVERGPWADGTTRAGSAHGRQVAHPAGPTRRPAPRERRLPLGLTAAVAAILLVVVAASWWLRDPSTTTPTEVYRAPAAAPTIESQLPAGATLPRNDFVLQWSSPDYAALYTVEVADRELNVLFTAEEIPETELRVPPAALGDLPAGATVLWRVDALLPDATRIASPTFRAEIR